MINRVELCLYMVVGYYDLYTFSKGVVILILTDYTAVIFSLSELIKSARAKGKKATNLSVMLPFKSCLWENDEPTEHSRARPQSSSLEPALVVLRVHRPSGSHNTQLLLALLSCHSLKSADLWTGTDSTKNTFKGKNTTGPAKVGLKCVTWHGSLVWFYHVWHFLVKLCHKNRKSVCILEKSVPNI